MPLNMALLQTFSPSLSSSHSPHSRPLTSTPLCMLQRKTLNLQPKVFCGFGISTPSGFERRGVLVVRASSDVDGVNAGGADPPSEEKEAVPVENLPLESKLQLKLEAKLRMKLAKKIRLKRKRLVQKRRLRKKGRWPPSKMKKNKNV